jgi:hypothetical protein
MQEFFKDVEIVKQNIVVIKNATKTIGDINQQVLLATTSEREAELTSNLAPILAETNKKAAFAKAILQKLRDETEKQKVSRFTHSLTFSPTHPLTHSLTQVEVNNPKLE